MLNPDYLHERFKVDGYVNFDLRLFVPGIPELAEGISCIEEGRWSFIIKNDQGEYDLPPGERDEAERHHLIADQDRERGGFAFSFRWIPDTHENCDLEALQQAKQVLGSACVMDLLRAVTGRRPSGVSQCYLSWFEPGHFLGTHCDPGQSFGVALNLTKDWDPNFGGVTLLVPEHEGAVSSCLVPAPYQLLVFDTSVRRIPHLVSKVSAPAGRKRLAAIARYRS
ncbi:hypothetical protein J7J08_02420 [Stenotrophomonas sp. ISL-67]|uniref:hypothetical protein n=1 Tax=Stenotrophomonas sp. ISL-67 TaxID=2819171 RepID=UPI001BE6895A|nr:hypothetical protein [Stenotrophomonas sp. ISL-67]MBT2766490.1 hypothetical protein [Stenotrophomonas sp. ISL-67]